MAVGAETQITDLSLDDHACLTFGENEELFDLTCAFVRDGVSGGSRVVWLCDQPRTAMAELAGRGAEPEAAAAGQVLVVDSRTSLLADGVFQVGRAMDWLEGQRSDAAGRGFSGLRVALDMSWALRPVEGIELLPAFEEAIATDLAGTGTSVLCQYDRDRFDPVTLATVAQFHTHAVAAATYHHDPLLRICRQYAPPGIRVAGQIDHTAQDALNLALTEAIRAEGDITVNLTELSFIDLTCARMILDAGRGLPAGRRMILRCAPAVAPRFVLLGATALPRLQLVTVDDR